MPPISQAPYEAVKQAQSLFADINKTNASAGGDGDSLRSEYESKFSDDEILSLQKGWKNIYQAYYSDIEKTQKLAYDYWIGKQQIGTQEAIEGRMLVDNRIFQALEVFLPIATQANPDPVTSCDNSPEGQKLSYDVKNVLVFQADKQMLRSILKDSARDWALFRIGAIKIDYDFDINDIKTEAVNPRDIIFDKNGYVSKGGIFVGEYLGLKKKLSASRLSDMFPKKKNAIFLKVGGKLSSKLSVIEWWYKNTDVFYTLDDDIVLGKYKNPHWNYDGQVMVPDPMTGESRPMEIKGRNHFPHPLAPFVFITVFNTRIQPHDDTSLILQNISNQDLINKRYRQIDKNIESQNNGIVVSEVFTSEQAAMAASALRKGGAVRVPGGDVTKAFMRDSAPPLTQDVWRNLQDARSEVDGIFGTSGSTAQNQSKEETVRGKILLSQTDSSRIGGSITYALERAADTIYNWWVQMMFVYYDEPHFATALGNQGALEILQVHNQDLNRTIMVTVKEGSLIPKDPLTQRNEVIDLWSANAVDPITLYTKLDYPDPYNQAKQLLQWQLIQKGGLPPQAMFPDFPQPVQPIVAGAQQGQEPQQPTGAQGPGEISQQPEQTPQGAVAQQSQQMMSSVPIGGQLSNLKI